MPLHCKNPVSKLMRQSGKNSIIANGTLTEDITEGTMISVRVKAGALTVYHKELDLCDLAKSKSDITCPIKAGPINIEKEFEIPKNIPHVREHLPCLPCFFFLLELVGP